MLMLLIIQCSRCGYKAECRSTGPWPGKAAINEGWRYQGGDRWVCPKCIEGQEKRD